MTKYFLKTFGCAQNTADSEKIKAYYHQNGFQATLNQKEAEVVVINSCVIRESAENRVYGLINEIKKNKPSTKIVVTGCLVGANKLSQLKQRIPEVDEWKPIDDWLKEWKPLRDKKKAALVTISNGCNNFCSYCIVPYARGKEISRPMAEVLKEVDEAIEEGFEEVVLIGQNVNSYNPKSSPTPLFEERGGTDQVVHMGKKRFRSLFPRLLEEIANKPIKKISFISSNPWDFSDELIETIAKHANIDRLLHLPFQSGDDQVLKNMNRGYTKMEYLDLVKRIKKKILDVRFSTDIIIGFPGEDEVAFQNTVDVCKQVEFEIAYINKYSPRRGTVSAKLYKDEIPMKEKKRRWVVLNELVNKKIKS